MSARGAMQRTWHLKEKIDTANAIDKSAILLFACLSNLISFLDDTHSRASRSLTCGFRLEPGRRSATPFVQ